MERFFHFDPLIALTTFIASRAFFISLALAGVTILVTIVLGRVVCGWACPLGAVHQFASFVFKKTKFLRPKRDEKASVAWKYYVLVFVLASAVFTLDLVGILDPLSFLYRSFAIGGVPRPDARRLGARGCALWAEARRRRPAGLAVVPGSWR